jgi:hypothetical protein
VLEGYTLNGHPTNIEIKDEFLRIYFYKVQGILDQIAMIDHGWQLQAEFACSLPAARGDGWH